MACAASVEDSGVTARTIDIREAQAQLTELVRRALAGDDVRIVDGERLVARLVAVNEGLQAGRRIPGLYPGTIWTSDDFDAPLPDEFWTGMG